MVQNDHLGGPWAPLGTLGGSLGGPWGFGTKKVTELSVFWAQKGSQNVV